MKTTVFAAGLFFALACAATLRADDKSWKMLWYPRDKVYSSWNWNNHSQTVEIENANSEKFPEGVQNWELAVCSVADPAKRALVPLPDSLSIELGLFYTWMPGRFRIDKLEALGDGTFLCAIIGDGRRYSNVSRVTINRAYVADPKPGITLTGISFPSHDIHAIAFRVVPAPGEKLYRMDLAFPFVCVDGTWSMTGMCSWEGPNDQLEPGMPYLGIVGLGGHLPPLTPFSKARVQLKIIEDYENNWTFQNHGLPLNGDKSAIIKRWAGEIKGPLSPVFTLTTDDSDTAKFEQVFGKE